MTDARTSQKRPDIGAAARRAFARELKQARLAIHDDAENFSDALFALERLGQFLYGKQKSLDDYEASILELARESLLAESSGDVRASRTPVDVLYQLVQFGRNQAMHQGALARNLARHLVELLLVLEDALMSKVVSTVADFMTRDVLVADLWRPLSHLRQVMLAQQYSFLPFRAGDVWHFLSDHTLALALKRDFKLLDMTLEASLNKKVIDPGEAAVRVAIADSPVKALELMAGRPALVFSVAADASCPLAGIVTPFDLL